MRKAIEISTNIGCRNNCDYCPQKTIIEEYRKHSTNTMMTIDTFKTIPIEDIVTFSGYSEPFLNSDTTKMILYAYNKGYNIQVYTTLIGIQIDDILYLKDIDFDCFTVHLPSIKEDFFNTPMGIYLTLLEHICSNIKNLDFVYFKDLPEEIIYIMDKYGYTPVDKEIISRSGLIKPVKHIHGPGFCPLYINVPIILPNGDRSLCCMDYRLKHINKSKKQMKQLLRRYDSDIICRDCEFMIPFFSYRYPVYIITELLKKLGFNYWEYRNVR